MDFQRKARAIRDITYHDLTDRGDDQVVIAKGEIGEIRQFTLIPWMQVLFSKSRCFMVPIALLEPVFEGNWLEKPDGDGYYFMWETWRDGSGIDVVQVGGEFFWHTGYDEDESVVVSRHPERRFMRAPMPEPPDA